MIPTAVAREARENLLDYLQTTYGLTDPAFERALLDYLAGPEGIFRGPWVDVRLPFRQARDGTTLPLEVAPPFRPYRHQLRAFERLHGQRGHQPQHTLVTTGTGSGKTECFLYPVLDHCWRARKAGERGIKAILLYPMNALATDQARRLAKTLWDDERLKGKVTAGLYVGGKGTHQVPDREHLVDDRKALRQAPPDILLTNYKMLDFLLLRPEDQSLWRDNGPETLRFLVLDELHTYDGAQGSDVACLIRRLKARVEAKAGSLCCVGTSATIGDGDEGSKERLTRFATEIFDEPFLSDSVITEDRLGIEEALGSDHDLTDHPAPGDLGDLDPRGRDPEAWMSRQRELWLGAAGPGLSTVEVGERLEQHDFLRSVLRALGARPLELRELIEKLARREEWFGELDEDGRALALDSFLALVSHARRLSDPDAKGGRREEPFLQVQVQLWLREVRGLLRSVDPEPRFVWRSELGGRLANQEDRTRSLPMVRCRECGCVGLAAVQREHEERLRDDTEEREIGKAWMTRDPSARFVVFGHGAEQVGQRSLPEFLCPACLRVGHDASCDCEGSSSPEGLPVRVVRELTDDKHPKFRPLCPECGADDTLIFLASRASSLLSVSISHLYQTEYNTDRKLLAFVDSVQDASHRAGFFGARTYRFNLRALIQELLQSAGGRLPLQDVGERLIDHTVKRLDGPARAIPVLVPEDLRAHADYERFLERRGNRVSPDLRAWLASRLSLEVAFEYGYSVRQGRSLEKTGCSTLEVDQDAVGKAIAELAIVVAEDAPFQTPGVAPSEDDLAYFVAGLLNRMRLRGGIWQELLDGYVRGAGNRYLLSRRMNPTGPIFALDAVLPRFLMEHPLKKGVRSVFDAFAPAAWTWFRDWASRTLGVEREDDGIRDLYRLALERLVDAGVVRGGESEKDGRAIWGLAPEHLTLVEGVRELICSECKEVVRLPERVAGGWSGRPCTRYRCTGQWGEPVEVPETFYTRIFRAGRVARVFPEEHTGLLAREVRESIEERFKSNDSPNGPNLLVCTPTLEMGIDIGDLSAVMLCSVPPTTSMYLQRIGRAGRSTGNALCLTMATSRPHDLYFHADPTKMMGGAIDPPGCFLDAPEMLKRQVVAFAMDHWARVETEVDQIPRQTTAVLVEGSKFPARFLEYYEAHKNELLRDFVGRFDRHSLSEESREELELFALSDNVADRVRRAFEDVRAERARLKILQQRARKRVEELEEDPDSATGDAELEKADAIDSHRMLGRLITEQGKRYPLNVLTDAGVLPNYAFPEPGVELESVVRSDDGGKRKYVAHQYQRPASAAIRELAPFASFYAEGRRVRVDEVDLGSRANPLIEIWRLCAACEHSERDESGATPISGCPVCGDGRWGDVGQRRSLVYFRRSRSLATRLEAASADDGEERHKARYQTHDLIDVQPENCGGARLIEDLPFGFEMLRGLKLREVNFGPETDESFEVAGHRVNEHGFQVCRDCGRVKPEDNREPINHSPTCRSQKSKEERVEPIYLYREVESEAIRILMPVAELDLEVQRASFKAALEYGLRLRYGGRAPHLSVKAMREPIRGGGHRNFLVLFDAVPGGTGFLADLRRDDALMDLLQGALAAIEACPCVREDADGCYRCLFAYQNQRELELTSRKEAAKLLKGIVGARAQLRDIDTLSDVTLESTLESELEERFIRALTARAKRRGGSSKKLQDGKEVWEIKVGERRWEVRPQIDLGPAEGVDEKCRPDFLIVPMSTGGDPRSIAVFCDGFAYHVCPEKEQSRLGDDVVKRRSILDSGRYLVWSVTWKDVEDFEAGGDAVATSLFAVGHSKPGQTVVQRWGLQPVHGFVERTSMELLWLWLARPMEREWLAKLASIGADFLVRTTTIEGPTIIQELEEQLLAPGAQQGADPEEISVTRDTKLLGRVVSRFGVKLMGRLAIEACKGQEPRLPIWTLRLFDDHERRKDAQFAESWRAFLQATNLLQFIEGAYSASTEDVAMRESRGADVYPMPRPDEGYSIAAEAPDVVVEEADPLEDLELEKNELEIARAVLAAGGPVPEPGYELFGADGRFKAMAELAWPDQRVAVLLDAAEGDESAFIAEGWSVFDRLDSGFGPLLEALNSIGSEDGNQRSS